MALRILQRGSCEPLKAGVHAAALGLFAIMGLYNVAAWLTRRQRHLAVNAALYSALVIVEQKQVGQHLAELKACRERASEAAQAAAQASAPPAPKVPTQFAA